MIKVLASLICIFTVSPCMAETQLNLHGLLDARLIITDHSTSWLDGGLAKTRYGSDDDENAALFRLSQVSLVLAASHDDFSARFHLNIDAEPDRIQTGSRIDLIEGFASYRHVISPQARFRLRGGFFFPPVSLEDRDTAWTSSFSITTSAINSWIGEEVRVTGAEVGFAFSQRPTEYSIALAVFGNNDPAGTLLAWRGWSLHDRQSGLTDRLPLPEIPPLQPGGLFPKQPDFVEPFREVDGRPGFYASASARNKNFEINGIYYNNRGIPSKFDGVQYAWKTDFVNVGIDVPFQEHWEFLTQFLNGHSRMGIGDMVHIKFDSFYALATASFDPFRWTLRYDHFRVQDQDAYQIEDDNHEKGNALTFAWMMSIREKFRIAAELLRVHSERAIKRTDWQFQTSFRFQF
jgi:hypothetical protein